MATNQLQPNRDRFEVFCTLFDVLCRLRSGVHQREMADHVLRHARGSTELVALVDGGARAVFYDSLGRSVYALPFDSHGVDEDELETLWRYVGDAGSWVDAHGEELDWVHPRYDWATDLDTSTWRYGK